MTTRILVVEADRVVANEVERHLVDLGYEPVARAERADEACSLAERLRPDLVLLDVHLEGDARDLDAAVTIQERLAIPVVLLVEHATWEVIDRARRVDPSGYVLKPADARSLRFTVEIAINKARVDRQLRESESLQRLQSAALNAVANGVFITDRSHTIQWVNPAFEELTGYTRAEACGRAPRELLRPDAKESSEHLAIEAALAVSDSWSGELPTRRRDGSHFASEITITPVCDARGEATHYICVLRDVTEQRRLQQEFLQAQKMEIVGRLAGGIAHDFNNLLTVINGASELALLEMSDDDPRRLDLQEIRDAAERARRLTRQLLAFSHKQRVTRAVLSVSAQVKAVAGMIRRLIGEDVRLEIVNPPEGQNDRVLCDEGQLEQVLLNLAVNARDAMPAGGVLTLETREVELDADFAARHAGVCPGPHVMLVVSDTGVGMTREVKARLFEPFFTTKGQGKGTGLGLATVLTIVSQCGGCVDVQSEPGQGATFKVMLPRVRGEEERATLPPQRPVRGHRDHSLRRRRARLA